MRVLITIAVISAVHLTILALLGRFAERCTRVQRVVSRSQAIRRSIVSCVAAGCLFGTGAMAFCLWWWYPFGPWFVMPQLALAYMIAPSEVAECVETYRIRDPWRMAFWVYAGYSLEGLACGLLVGMLRPIDRRIPGHCRECSYDLTGNESGACPECGVPTEEEVSAFDRRKRAPMTAADRDEFPRRRGGSAGRRS